MKTEKSRSMKDSVALAVQRASQWHFKDEDELSDVSYLSFAAEEHDSEYGLDPEDEESYYVVTDDGAIGLTEDDGASVDWLYIPKGHSLEEYPEVLAEESTQIFCSSCGKPNPGDSVFCTWCGAKI